MVNEEKSSTKGDTLVSFVLQKELISEIRPITSYYDHAYFALGNSLLFHFPGMEDIYCMISKYSDNIKISRAQRT